MASLAREVQRQVQQAHVLLNTASALAVQMGRKTTSLLFF
jgi:hypothetical protein